MEAAAAPAPVEVAVVAHVLDRAVVDDVVLGEDDLDLEGAGLTRCGSDEAGRERTHNSGR